MFLELSQNLGSGCMLRLGPEPFIDDQTVVFPLLAEGLDALCPLHGVRRQSAADRETCELVRHVSRSLLKSQCSISCTVPCPCLGDARCGGLTLG